MKLSWPCKEATSSPSNVKRRMTPSLLAEANWAPVGFDAGSRHKARTTSLEFLIVLRRVPEVLNIRMFWSAQPAVALVCQVRYIESQESVPVMTVSLS